MSPSLPAGRGALVLLPALAFGAGACRGAPRPPARDSGAQTAAADAGASEGGLAGVSDAAPPPPPDDTMLPPTSADITARARHLVEAIGEDDSTLASDILFPRDAWLATRDAKDPGKDWDSHVAVPFRKAVHAIFQSLKGKGRPQAAALELGGAIAQVDPRRHSWKKSMWTVRGSRLTFVVDGRTRAIVVREMVAWRGAWYVTRLR